ncbi:MAG TPA: hypothetical protein VFM79_07440 [Pelobium sp.]|nr:hypothetical protein [Pelobium sp.]
MVGNLKKQSTAVRDENRWAIQSSWKEHPDKGKGLVTTIFNGCHSADKLHQQVKEDVIQKLKERFVGLNPIKYKSFINT